MSMRITSATTTHTLPHINTLQAAGQLVKNTSKAAVGVTRNLMLHPSLMRRNSLIISTLILVLSRIGIAFQTANKAKGTEEESYRFKEAVKTTIREAGGWTLTYGFFRGVEYVTRFAMRKYFGVNKRDFGLGMGDFKREFGYAMRHQKSPFKGVKHLENLDNYVFEYTQKARYEKIEKPLEKAIGGFRKFFKLGPEFFPTEAARKLSRMRGLYNLVPVIAATIPTVILSGVLLERYTRDHADEMAENVANKWRVGFDGGNKKSQGIEKNQVAYNAFFTRVNELQQQRGTNLIG